MLLPLKSMTGAQVGEIELNDAVFAAPVSKPLMHQALMRQLSNARLGTHSTKTRSEVAGGGRKPWRQKGTGRARQGSTRASQWVGGGTVFGPRPRKYIKQLPKKMNAAALRSALSVKAAAEQLVIVDALHMDAPKTKEMIGVLNALGVNNGSVLLVLSEKSVSVQRSANNLSNVTTVLSGYINIRDLLGYDNVLLSQDAVIMIEEWLLPNGQSMTQEDIEEADDVATNDVVAEEITAAATDASNIVTDNDESADDGIEDVTVDDAGETGADDVTEEAED